MPSATILGPYLGNQHFSIDNYFNYCVQSAEGLPLSWTVRGLRPGGCDPSHFVHDCVPRRQAWKDVYFDWPKTLRQMNTDLYHIVDHGLAWYKMFLRQGKTIITVHDLINVLVMNGNLSLPPIPARRQIIINLCIEQIKKADALICVSTKTASDVMSVLGISSQRISVIHNIVPPIFKPLGAGEREAARKKLHGSVEHVVLHVGKPSPYKNRIGAIQIFDIVHSQLPDSKLVLTSQKLTHEEESFLSERACAKSVLVYRPETQDALHNLYCTADVFLFPSVSEGFGWPPVEAMACGCPVVTSCGGALGETVGDGGISFDNPNDFGAFANAAVQILKSPDLSSELRAKGLSHVRKYSRDMLAPRLVELYKQIGNSAHEHSARPAIA